MGEHVATAVSQAANHDYADEMYAAVFEHAVFQGIAISPAWHVYLYTMPTTLLFNFIDSALLAASGVND